MSPSDLLDALAAEVEQRRRRYTPGLLVSFVDFLRELGLPRSDVSSFDGFLALFPRMTETQQGSRANQLIVAKGEHTVGVRPFYNAVETLFRKTHHRFDYPKMAPHATQAWQDYTSWLDALCGMTETQLEEVRQGAIDFVLQRYPDQGFDPSQVEVPTPVFTRLLEEFDFVAPKGEPSGAAFQGAVFGFVRADNPHLQVEIRSVRSGSKREQRVGDVDAWDGERLAITAEVKNFRVDVGDVDGLEEFIHEASRRGAIGMVVAQSFSDEARQRLEGAGIKALSTDDLITIVELWDPAKQRIAVESFRYYAKHIEKKSVLRDRIRDFLADLESGGTP